jgi:hypothetical protein
VVVLGVALVMAGRSDEWHLFEEEFEQVKIGMSEGQVHEILGTPYKQLGPGGEYPPPLEGTPTRIWFYGPNLTPEESPDPVWSVGFRNGRVLLLETPEA